MKAAVIEDEMSHRMLLCEEIRKWGLDTKEPVSICEYDSAEAFLFDWEDQPSFDVLFIDIQMGQMDGVAMARKIREKDRNTALVFTTGVAEWMSVGYEVEALHYLLKPIDDKKLRECLERVREKRKTKQCLTFKGENGVYRFDGYLYGGSPGARLSFDCGGRTTVAGVPDPGEYDRSQPETAAGPFCEMPSVLSVQSAAYTPHRKDNINPG